MSETATLEPDHQRVLIVDYGSQVTQLIARRVREDGVFCEVHPCNKVDGAFLDAFRPQAVILSGGPESVTHGDSPRAPDRLFELDVPVLGICYGEQTMCAQLGGAVESGTPEYGRAEIEIVRESPLFEGLGGIGHREPVWMSHGDCVTAMPKGFEAIAVSEGRALRRHRRRGAAALRRAVPPGGGPHAARRADPAQLRPPYRRPFRRLDHGQLPRRGGAPHPRAGGRGQGDLRPVRRGGFLCRRRADPRGHRRAAHLRVRRHRPSAREGGRGGRRRCSEASTTSRWCTWTRTGVPGRAERRQRAGSQAQERSAGSSSSCSTARRRRSRARPSSPRARSTPT